MWKDVMVSLEKKFPCEMEDGIKVHTVNTSKKQKELAVRNFVGIRSGLADEDVVRHTSLERCCSSGATAR